MTTLYGAGGLEGHAVPYPTTPQPIRPVERREWRPWDKPGRLYGTPADTARAQRDAAKVLREADARRAKDAEAKRSAGHGKGAPRADIDEAELVRLYTVEKWTAAAVARHMGVSPRTITKRLIEHDIPLPGRNGNRTKITDEQLIREFHAGLGGKAIAEKYGMAAQTIWTRLWRLRQSGVIT